MISPSIPPSRPAGAEERGGEEGGGRGRKGFIAVHSFIAVDLFIISSFGFQNQHRIYISKSVTFYVFFMWSCMCTEDITSVFYFISPPQPSVSFLHSFGIHLPQWPSLVDVIPIL